MFFFPFFGEWVEKRHKKIPIPLTCPIFRPGDVEKKHGTPPMKKVNLAKIDRC